MKTKLLLICSMLLQFFFAASAFSQALVPLASFSEPVMQTHGFKDMVYVVSGNNMNNLSIYAYNEKTAGVPKLVIKNLRTSGDWLSPIQFMELNGKLYLLGIEGGTAYNSSIYEIKDEIATEIHKVSNRRVDGSWVTDNRNKIFMKSYDSGNRYLDHYDFVKDERKNLITQSNGSLAYDASIIGDKLIFSNYSSAEGNELWVSDGTATGTNLLKDIRSGGQSSSPRNMFAFNKRVYFYACDGSDCLMRWTDGTKVETLKDPSSGQTLDYKFFLGATAQFVAVGSYQTEVIIIDKNNNIETINTDYRSAANVVNNKLYFSAGDYGKVKLYVSNGTVSGTSLVSDMSADTDGSQISQIIENGNKAAFLYRNTDQSSKGYVSLWESDGSGKGTKSIIDSLRNLYPDTIIGRTKGSMIISHKGSIYLRKIGSDSLASKVYKVSNKATKVKILAFIDEDADGEKDASESTVNAMELNVGLNKLKIWTNQNGMANINLDPGTYSVSSPMIGDGWKISGAGSSGLEIKLPKDQGKTIYFAIQSLGDRYENEGLFGYARQRCNFVVPFWLNVRNTGTVTSDIEMKLVLDSQVTYDSSSVTPDSLDTVNNCITWKFAALKPLRNQRVKLFAKMPGVNSMGDKLHYTLYLTNKDGGVSKFMDTIIVKDSLGCSYDPNDKQVLPQRELGGVYLGEKLKYKIRFQNTGNDTALNVKLVDTLSRNLDWGSLKILGSSHPVETQLTDGGVLTFFFDDIYLADSNINEPESHGFVDYRIKQKAGLKLGDEIENTAYIYFDFNPAIITNTTYNILVKPSGVADEVTGDDLIEIYPNPMDNQLNIRFENVADRQIEISNSVGMILHTTSSDADQIQLETSQWSTGIYLIKVLEGKDTKVFKVIKE